MEDNILTIEDLIEAQKKFNSQKMPPSAILGTEEFWIEFYEEFEKEINEYKTN